MIDLSLKSSLLSPLSPLSPMPLASSVAVTHPAYLHLDFHGEAVTVIDQIQIRVNPLN